MKIIPYHDLFVVSPTFEVENAFSKDLLGSKHPEFIFIFKYFDIKEVFDKKIDEKKWILDYLDSPDSFDINSKFFRSDEFTDNHKEKHILFSGCSVTYGSGLYNNEIWPYLLYNKIKQKENLSGYYNLAIPGTSIFEIVTNIFKYIDNYSKPDCIFINLPSFSRFYSLLSNKTFECIKEFPLQKIKNLSDLNYFHTIYQTNNKKIHPVISEKIIYAYQYLLMLEIFCKINNIDLYLFSYDALSDNILKFTDLSSFYSIKDKESSSKIFEYHQNNPQDKFYLLARDNAHVGTASHYIWAEEIYKKYSERNYVN